MGVNMLLTMGGLILLGTFILYSNGLLFDNARIAENNEFVISAISLAQSVIDEAKTKSFDQKAIGATVVSAESLTVPQALGADVGELLAVPDTVGQNIPASVSRFNDVDDYNGYTRVVNTSRAENYMVQTTVSYASETNPDSIKTSRTFCKRMAVTVTSPYIPYPVKIMYAFVY